ncbi:hypothetical protein FB451DRAFT_1238330 [Mycena latifolia]|nr:hypothetical protein FB451DRAFT_1238330 [Mycena latifolia]
MDIEVAPEELEAYTKRWALKWHYFQEAFPETSQDDINGMGRDEMRERITWLEGEFTRISGQILRLQEQIVNPTQTEYEILAGALFVINLIQDCQPDLVSILAKSKTNGENSTLTDEVRSGLDIQVGQLKNVEKTHMFALRCINEMTTMKQTLAVRLKLKISRDNLSSPGDNESRSLDSAASPVATASVEPSEPPNVETDHPRHLGSRLQLPVAGTNPTAPSDLTTLRSALPDLRNPRQVVAIVNHGNEPVTLSSANSHMKNLTALLGIAFFGASITWSTIFSGTRGNLVVISWAACFFIVAAVGAAGASILVMQDEDIVALYPAVRWTVRILSLMAMLHVLAGMFLVATAILVLDPENVNIDVRGGRRGTQSAGAYAISVSTVIFIVVGAVWRRNTRRTWFG